MRQKLRLAVTAGALAVALILAFAACGGDGDSDGVASLTDTTGQSTTDGAEGSGGSGSGAATQQEREEAGLEFAQCMREHGIDFPDPVNGRFLFRARPGDEAKMQDAQEACQPILEAVGPPPLDEEQQAEQREAWLAFAQCMREHGIDMPDPEFQDGGVEQRMPEGAEDDPKFDDAQRACQPILDDAQLGGPSGQGAST